MATSKLRSLAAEGEVQLIGVIHHEMQTSDPIEPIQYNEALNHGWLRHPQ